MKALENIDRFQLDNKKLMLLIDIYEEKGREYYYNALFKKDQDSLLKRVYREDMFYLGLLLEIDFTESKLKQWSKKDFVSRTKEEALFNNYKKAIKAIHKNGRDFELFHSNFDELANLLSKGTNKIKYADSDQSLVIDKPNLFSQQKPKERKIIKLDQLVNTFNEEAKRKNHEYLTLVINFYIDFINMNFFTALNEEMGLIMFFGLIQKHFQVFRYVSFFKHLFHKKVKFYQGVSEANYNWDEGYSRFDFLYTAVIELMKESYDELKGLAHKYSFERTLIKTDDVEGSILKGNVIFSKADVRKNNPHVSDSTINRTLKRMQDEGTVRCLGTGRSAKWQLIRPGDKEITQLELFSDGDFINEK